MLFSKNEKTLREVYFKKNHNKNLHSHRLSAFQNTFVTEPCKKSVEGRWLVLFTQHSDTQDARVTKSKEPRELLAQCYAFPTTRVLLSSLVRKGKALIGSQIWNKISPLRTEGHQYV